MKRLVTLLALIMSILMIFGACDKATGGKDAKATSTKDTLFIRIPGDPETMDANTSGAGNKTMPVQFMILEGLMRQDYANPSAYVPCLATSWEIDADGLGYTFHLREGIKFHNGEKMTVDDVVYSFVDLGLAGIKPDSYPYIDYANIKAVDDKTVHVPLFSYNVGAIAAIASTQIYCKSYMEAHKDDPTVYLDKTIGTGPYVMTEWQSGSSVTLKRFADYWGTPAIIETLVYRVISEMAVALMEVETGGIDVLLEANFMDAKAVKDGSKGDKLKVFEYPGLLICYVGFNMGNPEMDNLKLRQAIAYATDRDSIMTGAFNDSGHKAMSVVPETAEALQMFTEETWPYPYDVEKAKAALTEAGYPNGITLKLIVDGDENRRLMAEQLKNQLAQIGITLEIEMMETATATDLLENTSEGYHMYLRRFGYTGPGMETAFRNTVGKVNHMAELPAKGWTDLDALLTQIGKESDEAKRIELEKQVQDRFLTEWLFWYPVQHTGDYTITASNFQNFRKVIFAGNFNECYFD